MKTWMKFRWAALAAAMALALPAWAADGDPDVNPVVRAKEAVKKLNVRPNVALLYVKGMT